MTSIYYSNHISWQQLKGETYVIDETTHDIYVLSDVAQSFWLLVKDYSAFSDIIEIMSSLYDVDRDIIENDLIDFKLNLVEQNLVKEVESN